MSIVANISNEVGIEELAKRIVKLVSPARLVLFANPYEEDVTTLLVVLPHLRRGWSRHRFAAHIYEQMFLWHLEEGLPVGIDLRVLTVQDVSKAAEVGELEVTTALEAGQVLYDSQSGREGMVGESG